MSERPNQPTAASASGEPGSKQRRGPTTIERVGRALLVGVVIYGAVIVWQMVADWRDHADPPHNAASTDAAVAATGDPAEIDWSAFVGGGWRFADLPFQLLTSEVSGDRLAARLEARPDVSAANSAAALPGEILKFFRSAGESSRAGNLRRYVCHSISMQAVAFTRGEAADEQVIAVRAAIPKQEPSGAAQAWLLFEASVATAPAAAASGGSRLLEIPPGGSLVATRCTAAGETLGRLLICSHERDLPAFWRQQGWTVTGGSGGHPAVSQWLCRRGAAVCFAVQVHTGEKGNDLLLIAGEPTR